MSDIPQGRRELRAVARALQHGEIDAELAADLIREIVDDLLVREPPVRRAPDRYRRITPVMKAQIRAYATLHPAAHQVDIGNLFGINPGRVSEILTGKR
ncbi:MAG: hypothetical protein RLZZ09_1097 [Pseudomonadota bacterium]|jgi:hypothetical protein